jgi:hypothetical protein
MSFESTREGKWVLFEKSTGKRLERWPVDAREILKLAPDAYTRDASQCDAPAEAPPPSAEAAAVDETTKPHPLGVPIVAGAATAAVPMQPPTRTSGAPRSIPR